MTVYFFSAIGDGWGPAVLNTENEFNFVRHAKGFFVDSYHQKNFIGGSTDVEPNPPRSIEYSDYLVTSSGNSVDSCTDISTYYHSSFFSARVEIFLN